MEEIEPTGRIVRPWGGGGPAGGKVCLELEGVLLNASEIEARGRGGAAEAGTAALLVALDLRDATEPAGDTTAGREVTFTSAGEGLDEVVDANENKVAVRDLGAGGAPVAEGALGGSIDDLLLGGGGADVLDEAIVADFVGFEEVVVGFLEGVVVLERGEEGDVVVALPGGAGLAPAPNVACPAHG